MLQIGSLQLETNLLLAPIAGYCDLAFRLVVRSIRGPSGGVGLACTDLLCPQAVLGERTRSMWLAATCAEDRPLCMQLYGADAGLLAEAAVWAQAHGAAVIDINMGCPVDKVTRKNGGSRLLCDLPGTVRLARQVVEAVTVPVTAKIRLGWDETSLVVDTFPAQLADVGIAAVTVHGRTTAQRFRGSVCLDGIRRVVACVARSHPHVAVIGNGDVTCADDARRMMAATGCHGVMIGRGALGQPWVFRDTAHYLATGRLLPPLPRGRRARLVLDHFENLLRLRGPRAALNTMRQRVSVYSPHLQPWPGLRRDVRGVQSVEQMRAFLGAGIDRIERDEEAVLGRTG